MLYSTVPPCLRLAPSLVISVTGEPVPAYWANCSGGGSEAVVCSGSGECSCSTGSISLASFTDGVLVIAFS